MQGELLEVDPEPAVAIAWGCTARCLPHSSCSVTPGRFNSPEIQATLYGPWA
jgi:hypothetical protein